MGNWYVTLVSIIIQIGPYVFDFEGNGWAALGMIRVQSTIMKSDFADDMSDQISSLQYWVKEVLDGTFAAIVSSFYSGSIDSLTNSEP